MTQTVEKVSSFCNNSHRSRQRTYFIIETPTGISLSKISSVCKLYCR